MKKLVHLFISFTSVLLILMVSSCQKQEEVPAKSDGVSGAASSAMAPKAEDIDFDKKKDESCDTEEDLEKQIEEAKKKQEAFKLQGGDGGCTTD